MEYFPKTRHFSDTDLLYLSPTCHSIPNAVTLPFWNLVLEHLQHSVLKWKKHQVIAVLDLEVTAAPLTV